MRADRLLSLLMLLQLRGRLTARALALTLEVSERTIYRDVAALSATGVPIYADPGPGGGFALLESYRTHLTGLADDEVRALFMLSIPAPLADLGLQDSLRSALLKLAAALPAGRRLEEQRVRARFYLDTIPPDRDEVAFPLLSTIQQAVWTDRRLQMTYLLPVGLAVERLVDPLGLVARGGTWHLVAAWSGRVRVVGLTEVAAVSVVDEPVTRPPDFELVAFWEAWRAEVDRARSAYRVVARVAPEFVPALPRHFGGAVRPVGPPSTPDWPTFELAFDSLEAARDRLLSFGQVIEVVSPPALRAAILDFARLALARYSVDAPR